MGVCLHETAKYTEFLRKQCDLLTTKQGLNIIKQGACRVEFSTAATNPPACTTPHSEIGLQVLTLQIS